MRVRDKDLTEASNSSRVTAVLRRALVPMLALAACGVILVMVHRLAKDIDYHSMVHALRGTAPGMLLVSALATAASYISLIGRDVGALRYVGARVPTPILLLGSFCGTALGNSVGFGMLAGGAVRYRTYGAAGVKPEQVARMMAFITIGFGLGLAAYAAASMVVADEAIGRLIHVPPLVVRLGGGGVLAVVAGLVALCARPPATSHFGGLVDALPEAKLALAQLALTAIDLVTAAAALWVLLPAGRIDFATFSAVFAVATALGVISHVPGGIGVFEAAVVFALGHKVSPTQAAAALLAYRGIYFLLPLLLAGMSLAAFELRRVATNAGDRVLQAAGSLVPTFLGVITFAIGTMLLISGATPTFGSRLSVLQAAALPLWAVEVSNLLASLSGVFLLFVARGLLYRLDGAWWAAIIISLANLGLAITKGLAVGECLVIGCVVLLLLATRRQFIRPASFLRQPISLEWFAADAIVIAVAAWVLLLAYSDVAYHHEIWWEFDFDAQAPRALRAIVGAALLSLVAALGQLLRPASGRVLPPDASELVRAEAIIRAQGRSDAMLAMMGDKSFLFSASGQALLSYARHGRSWVALYDPVGPREEWPELIWRFVEMADAHAGRVAFYEVRPDSLPLYLDAGLKVMKLGEEACVHLADFTVEGSAGSAYRNVLRRGEREGFELTILAPGQVEAHLETLRVVSDSWLAHRQAQEKGFSVAAFAPGFIADQWVGLLRQNGRPAAFVSVMTTDLRQEATAALMRHTPDASRFAMEYVFISLALHLKQQGYQVFSLGMAPLAGMARNPLASPWHRMAGLFWEHGGRLYSFQGLRMFKAKFHPRWEPRYLAASGSIGPFLALTDVVALAGGGGGK